MPLLGCIADDFTGATDLAAMLTANGMRTVQVIGVPEPGAAVPDADALVVALKSRTTPAPDAVRDSLAALQWLRAAGCRQFFFKYCSTFDSTEAGNIGPVGDALIEALGCGFALACPAFPANGRSVYQGHLFVGSVLLNESGMQNHPLTPMHDANLVRVLSQQTEGTVGLVPYATVVRGEAAIRAAMTAQREQGRRWAIVDAVEDAQLMTIGAAASGHALVTGGSGVAMGLPENFRRAGLLPEAGAADDFAAMAGPAKGRSAILAGSCSRATLFQIGAARAHLPVLELDPLATPDAAVMTARALEWAEEHWRAATDGTKPILIAASAPPEKVAALQAMLGRDAAGALVEHTMAAIAEGLTARGVRRLVVAGGETSGAVVTRLGIRSLRIGPQIDPGVPWTLAGLPGGDGTGLLLALKSGNFGERDFFVKAFEMLRES